MKILICILFILGFIIFGYCYTNKVRLHFRTFLHKGFRKFEDDYGLYCFYADQGGGKTFSIVDILTHYIGKKKIYTNVESFAKNYKDDVIFESNFEKLISFLKSLDDCENIIVFYDEIFSLFSDRPMDDNTREVLTQLRKKHLYFFTTSQLWTELPKTFRKLCRYEVTCKMINVPIFKFSILINEFNDGYNIKWDDTAQEYVAPRLWTSIKKANLSTAHAYDTYEAVHHSIAARPYARSSRK